jgi:hypothetical protein
MQDKSSRIACNSLISVPDFPMSLAISVFVFATVLFALIAAAFDSRLASTAVSQFQVPVLRHYSRPFSCIPRTYRGLIDCSIIICYTIFK